MNLACTFSQPKEYHRQTTISLFFRIQRADTLSVSGFQSDNDHNALSLGAVQKSIWDNWTDRWKSQSHLGRIIQLPADMKGTTHLKIAMWSVNNNETRWRWHRKQSEKSHPLRCARDLVPVHLPFSPVPAAHAKTMFGAAKVGNWGPECKPNLWQSNNVKKLPKTWQNVPTKIGCRTMWNCEVFDPLKRCVLMAKASF